MVTINPGGALTAGPGTAGFAELDADLEAVQAVAYLDGDAKAVANVC